MKLFLISFSILISTCIFSFKTTDPTATIKFSKDQYTAVQSYLVDAVRTIDSLKVVLQFSSTNNKINESATRAQKELVDVSNFVGQIDSVFNPKAK